MPHRENLKEMMNKETKKSKIWLSSPHMGGGEMKYIQKAFDDNWIAPLGENIDDFEKDLEYYLDSKKFVSLVSSGTSSLHLALRILGIQAGDEVICQSLTFIASANPILYLNANPIFVDSEPDTWNISPDYLEQAIKDRMKKGKKPKAIILVHIYGMPAKMEEIMEIAHRYEIPIIEDAAEALGSSFKNKKCGTFGEMSILSFNGNKIITTSGGGALICSRKEEKIKADFLATQAREDQSYYEHQEMGYNYRMSNISAGIGRGQMEVLEKRILKRREIHYFYQRLFQDKEGISLHQEPNSDYFSNYWLSVVLIDSSKLNFDGEVLRLHCQSQQIETRPVWKPMHLQPIFRDAPYYGESVSERLFNQGLCLPSGSNMSDDDLERVSHAINQIINK